MKDATTQTRYTVSLPDESSETRLVADNDMKMVLALWFCLKHLQILSAQTDMRRHLAQLHFEPQVQLTGGMRRHFAQLQSQVSRDKVAGYLSWPGMAPFVPELSARAPMADSSYEMRGFGSVDLRADMDLLPERRCERNKILAVMDRLQETRPPVRGSVLTYKQQNGAACSEKEYEGSFRGNKVMHAFKPEEMWHWRGKMLAEYPHGTEEQYDEVIEQFVASLTVREARRLTPLWYMLVWRLSRE